MKKKIILWSGLSLLILLAVSLLIFFVFSNDRHEKAFFFYETGTYNEEGESRVIPGYHEKEKNIRIYVEELLLGPSNVNFEAIFPEGTRLNQIMLREKKLFLDINNMVLKTDISKSYNIGKSIKLLKKNIYFNFPGIDTVIFTISGEEPDIADTE